MTRRRPRDIDGQFGARCRSPAERLGIAAFALSLVVLFFAPWLIVALLSAFVLICFVMPFFPGVSFFFPVICRGPDNSGGVCLSFDDGPDPEATPAVLALLRQNRVRAAFFVTGERAARYPHLIEALLADGHTVGNHSYSHDNFIMFRSDARLTAEIEATQRVLGRHGISPHCFRPPVGIMTPRYIEPLRRSGLMAVTFSRRAGDRGNRRVRGLSRRILRRLRPGDIVLLHDTVPRRDGDLPLLLAELEGLIAGIKRRGLVTVSLATLLGRPAMSVWPESADPAVGDSNRRCRSF